MKRTRIVQRKRRGFTLLEVLLVLVILGVIAALVVPKLFGTQERAMVQQTKASIQGLKQSLDLYAVDHSARYPETLDDLLQPVDLEGQTMKPYLDKYPKDAWGQPLNYNVEIDEQMAGSQVALIWSNGPDGKDDTGQNDDINNWSDLDEEL